jgi:TRAP-type C4-dicarboxylate transport system permease small subunit
MVELWGDIGFLVFTACSIVFTLLYLTMSRWYKSFTATLIAIYMVGVAFLCVYLSLRIWDIYLPGVEWVRLTMFWILAVSMLTSVIGFLEIQFGKRGETLRKRLSKKYSDVRHDDKTEVER